MWTCKLFGHKYEVNTTWDESAQEYKSMYFACKRCGHVKKINLAQLQGEFIG